MVLLQCLGRCKTYRRGCGCLELIGRRLGPFGFQCKDPTPAGRQRAKINKEQLFPFEILQYIALCPLSTAIDHAPPPAPPTSACELMLPPSSVLAPHKTPSSSPAGLEDEKSIEAVYLALSTSFSGSSELLLLFT